MLIYNYQKEFIGISENDLATFGFSDLADLRSESADFADLFVKVPGFIHNFKHVHWIDFILSSDSIDGAGVIVHAKGKNYQCTLTVKSVYLIENPHAKSYMVHISNVMQTTDARIQDASTNLVKTPIQTPAPEPIITPIAEPTPVISEPTPVATPVVTPPPVEPVNTISEPVVDDAPIDISFDEPEITPAIQKEEPKPVVEIKKNQTEVFNNGYIYDPKVASDELGLPLDLIEEFIEDFIAQAHEFKTAIYNALTSRDSDTLKILSHKLKGVAANLRIEDAFEALTIINTSNDENEISLQLDTFYKTINKLEKKSEPDTIQATQTPVESNDDDDIDLDIFIQKDEPVKKVETVQTPLKEEKIAIDLPVIEDEVIQAPIPEPVAPIAVEDPVEEISTENITITYDKQKVSNEIGMTTDEFKLIFDDYVSESKELVNAIKEAIEISDIRQINRKSMQLKGMNDNMRVNDCKDELSQLQSVQELETAKQLFKKVEAVMQQIVNIKG